MSNPTGKTADHAPQTPLANPSAPRVSAGRTPHSQAASHAGLAQLASAQSLDWPEILQRLETFATSEPARADLRALSPCANVESARASFRDIDEARSILALGERPFAESLDLFSTWHSRLKREAVLTTLELRDVRRFCLEVLSLSEVLKTFDGPWAQAMKRQLMDAREPLSAIDHLMTPSGEIRNDASEALHHLYREQQNQTKALHATLERLVKAHEMEPLLQEKFVTTREGRWVIPVRSGMQHHFPGVIHSSSQSKQTVFMEPDDVVPLNNQLRQIEAEIEAEIERLLTLLSQYLRGKVGEFLSSQASLLEMDVLFAKAKLAEVLHAHRPDFVEDRLSLRELRHPILMLNGSKVISNSVELSPNHRILLLSGPNAGGKTVLLKSIGLAAQMARCGLPICAEEGSRLPFFRELQIAVGDEQSVDAALSTFAAHITKLHEAAQCKGSDRLLLVDEICGSTDPEEGSALARSFIERFAHNQVFAVITSHLGPLKSGWTEDSGVANGSLEYDQNSGQPTYRFFFGVPGQSLALQTARRVGVDETLLQRALDFLSPEAKARQLHLSEMESLKEELTRARRELMAELQETKESKRKYQELLVNFRRDRDQWLERSVKKAERKIDEMIEAARAEEVFRRHERLNDVKRELPEIVKAPAGQASGRKRLETLEEFEKVYPPGSKIFVPSMNHEGLIQGKANKKGEIPILVNSMRLLLNWEQLRPPQSMQNPTQSILRRASGVQVTLLDQERVVDVRGKTTEEAVAQLESQLDAAVLNSEARVKIIHGHGTETLKRNLRAHLSRSPYVKSWKAGTPDHGGDGVTWAQLK